jgi:DNA-directed RNA polymerase specialized sigma24 family protein
MSDLSFDDFAKQLTDASEILSDADVTALILGNKMQPVMLYAYRIAAYCASELRRSGKLPDNVDDTDYIDAVQECIIHVPALVRTWKPTHKFSTYVNRAFKNVISNYLWTQSKGGLGDYRVEANVDQFPDANDFDGEAEDDEYSGDSAEFAYDQAPQGYRDPMEELIAAEEEDRALRALMRPATTPKLTHERNIRAKKQLGLAGAKHE